MSCKASQVYRSFNDDNDNIIKIKFLIFQPLEKHAVKSTIYRKIIYKVIAEVLHPLFFLMRTFRIIV